MKWGDWIIIIAVLACAAGLFIYRPISRNESRSVYIHCKNHPAVIVPLNAQTNITFTNNRNHITVCIVSNYAYISESTCPLQLCVKKGRIAEPGESIICIPNAAIIAVKGTPSSAMKTDATCE